MKQRVSAFIAVVSLGAIATVVRGVDRDRTIHLDRATAELEVRIDGTVRLPGDLGLRVLAEATGDTPRTGSYRPTWRRPSSGND